MRLMRILAAGAAIAALAAGQADPSVTVTSLGAAGVASGGAATVAISTNPSCGPNATIVVVTSLNNNTNGATGVTDGAGNTYVNDKSTTTHFGIKAWSTHNASLSANAGITGTWPGNTQNHYMVAWCVAGLANGGMYDTAGAGFTGSMNAGTTTTIFSNDATSNPTEATLVYFSLAAGNGDTFTPDGTFGAADNSAVVGSTIFRSFHLVSASNSTYTLAPTNAAVRTYDANWFNYKDAPAPGGCPHTLTTLGVGC